MSDAVLEAGRVLVADERSANRLQDKGSFGRRTGRGVELDLHEAAFLVADGRLRVRDAAGPVGLALLLRAGSEAEPGFEVRHVAYRDARARGQIVRTVGRRFEVAPRGARPGATPPEAHMHPLSDESPLGPDGLARMLADARRAGCALWLAVVDADADVTHYEASAATLEGLARPPDRLDACALEVLSDRAIVSVGADTLAAHGFGGRIGGELVLPLPEAAYVAGRGAAVLPDAGAIPRAGARTHPDFAGLAALYASLRDAGCVPKTGLKFGVHYRVYTEGVPAGRGQAHAPFLVHHWSADRSGPVREVARLVRLAHSVRKKLVLATRPGLVEVRWFRP